MKKEVKIGVFFVVVFLIFAYFILKTESLFSLFSGQKTYAVYARFDDVAGLFRTSPVRIAGVKIGVVDQIELDDGKARLKMLIYDKFQLTESARAKTSSIGFIGEEFVEIVYKEKYRVENPKIIPPDGEIKTISGLDLDLMASRFDSLSEKIIVMVESINDVISDEQSKDAMKSSLKNLQLVTASMKEMFDQQGSVSSTMKQFDLVSQKLLQTLDSVNALVKEADGSIFGDKDGVLPALKSATQKIQLMSDDFQKMVQDMKAGKGTAGKLMTDEELYQKVTESVDSIHKILEDLGGSPDGSEGERFHFYAGLDYYTEEKNSRFLFGLNMNFKGFSLFTRVNEEPLTGDPNFTVMLGKSLKYISFGAGMVDSGLGLGTYLHLLQNRLMFGVEASRFYTDENPFIKALIEFSVTKNLHLRIGYEDILEEVRRKFLVGLSFSN